MSGTMPPAAMSEAPELALARAQAAGQAKRFGEAAGICNDVLAASPDNPAALALLGMISHTGDPERGVLMLERAIGLRAGVAGWYANLSALYRMIYRLQDALRVGKEAIRLEPQNADHLVSISLVFADLDDREEAIACLLRAVGCAPTTLMRIWRSVRTYWRWGSSSQAGSSTSGATRPRPPKARCRK